jgi:hypothetical protein
MVIKYTQREREREREHTSTTKALVACTRLFYMGLTSAGGQKLENFKVEQIFKK